MIELLLSTEELETALAPLRASGKSIGLVPTMGALHRGHASLIEQSVSANDHTVVSIFVNPIQFDSKSDLDSYPRTLDKDMEIAEAAGAGYIFCPSVSEMYPDGFSTHIDMTGATEILCGESRPGHFRGVMTVVTKLFGIVRPRAAYFGEKDAQQLFVIKKMTRELNIPVAVVGCKTIRDRDLLAVSSRNIHLSAEERDAAGCLIRALLKAGTDISYAGIENPADSTLDADKIRRDMADLIKKEPLAKLDYAEVIDADTFKPVDEETTNILCAVAAYFGETRLIDNMTYKRNGHEYNCPCCS
jgi:pantoate--beta-alanine ligase